MVSACINAVLGRTHHHLGSLTSAINFFYEFLLVVYFFTSRWLKCQRRGERLTPYCTCTNHLVVRMSCPLGGSSISRLLMYILSSSIELNGLCMMDQYSCSTKTWILLPFLWRTLIVGEYVLWILVTNNGIIWGLRRTRDPTFCSLLDKGCFTLLVEAVALSLNVHTWEHGGWPRPSAHPG